MEDKILGSEERSKALEYEQFIELRSRVLEHLAHIQETAEAIAVLDSSARSPRPRGSSITPARPQRDAQSSSSATAAIPCSIRTSPAASASCRTTSPLEPRKAASSSSPARTWPVRAPTSARPRCSRSWRRLAASCPPPARLGLVDRIFTRIGASDDIARGQTHLHGRDERDLAHPQQRHRALASSSSTRSAAARAPSTASASPGASPSTCTTTSGPLPLSPRTTTRSPRSRKAAAP
jgi:hypothetical protein